MAIQGNQGGNMANNTDKKGNKNTVNQGISNAGPTDNRNDRADVQKSDRKSGVVGNTDKKKQGASTQNSTDSKSKPGKKD